MGVKEDLGRIADAVQGRFEAQKRVLSFEEYLGLALEHPARHTRDAARYLRGAFDHYGEYEVDRPWGPARRFRLFDQPFAESFEETRSEKLVGHEVLQEAFYGVLSNFVQEGRANRLVLLHGPNGSAKTTFVQSLMRALEHYSTLDEGALYRFSWIFPRGRDGKTIGFGSTDDGTVSGRSLAHLPDANIDVKLPSELREHPVLLLPLDERRTLLRRAYDAAGIEGSVPDWIWNGQLGHKNQQIQEALLTAYRGDLAKVLSHVQVERYYVSRRYRVGAVTIGPQMAVDASERQITADRTLNSLPASLSSLTLYEPYGELVDASGGIVEFSDLLKRPLDAWKYLLLAIETGEVALPLSNLPINAVLVASSNEVHLQAFREHHEYNSFRGRLSQVRVPYLLSHEDERSIYDSQITPQVRRHVAPHTTYVAALWAVLTRLCRSVPDHFESSTLGRVAADLTPLEKASLYAHGQVPRRLSAEEARELASGVRLVAEEWNSVDVYEGLTGASPREIRAVLLEAANDPARTFMSPLDVIGRLTAFVERADHDFLKQSAERGYQDHEAFVGQVHGCWLDLVDDELRSSTGLIEETQYHELFDRYVSNVSYWVKKEKVFNTVTGKYEDPDEDLMRSLEKKIGVDSEHEAFRRNLITTVAGHAIDHPGEKVEYTRLFPRFIEKLRDAYYGDHKKQVGVIAHDVLALLDGGNGLDDERRSSAEAAQKVLEEEYGYVTESLREALGELVRERYSS
ncbi:MAG: serine protein kinase PrkA [Deltaproteobacteria bacterium]|nr:MAG: serine protein kinase PrkA [Deltaproteobacteria bacterium]